MIDTLVDNFRLVLLVGVVLVVGLGQINRVISAILGVLFFALMAFLGAQTYARGGAVGVLGVAFSPAALYGLCAVMAGLNLVVLRSALARNRRKRNLDSDA